MSNYLGVTLACEPSTTVFLQNSDVCLQTIEETLLQWLAIKQKKKTKQEKVLLAVFYEAVKQFQLDLAILSPEH